MKTLKKLAVAFVLIAGLGMAFASCSDDYTDIPGEPSNPIERPEIEPYQQLSEKIKE